MIKRLLSTPTYSFTLIVLISFGSLAAAFIAEGFLGLEPCKLCIYQRYPFALGLIFGLFGLMLRHRANIARITLSITGLNFLTNSGIATYHTGVEQSWWESAVDGCAVTFEIEESPKSILENIMSAPMGDCREIPWQDPIFGFSMANYNIALCFGLFLFCVFAAIVTKNQVASEQS